MALTRPITTTERKEKQKGLCVGKWWLFDGQDDEDGNNYYPFLTEAKELCDSCPVKTVCKAEWSKGATIGIWGGEPK